MKLPSLLQTILILPVLGLFLAAPIRADVNSDLAFSAFSNVDVNSLAGGTVLQKSSGLLNFPRAITTQALYVLDAQPADVQYKLVHWNPASHPELMVWVHNSLPAKPTPTDFSGLASLPDNSSVKAVINATAKLDPNNPSLQVDKNEAQVVATMAAQQKDPKTLFANSWSQILSGRIDGFLNGRIGSQEYIISGGNIQPLSEIRNLLHTDAKVYGQYQMLFNQTPFKSGSGTFKQLVPADLYYECFDIEGAAALGTGAVFQAPNGTSFQSADFEYEINSGIYATVELEELWPVTVNGKTETLVWREDMVSAPNVAYLHGTERLASGMIMLQDVKQAVNAFRSEFK